MAASGLDDIQESDIKIAVQNVMNARMKDLEAGSLTKKEVRREVETNLGLPKKSLDGKKKFITRCIEDFIAAQSPQEEDEEEESLEEPPKKRQKRETKKKTKKATKKTKKTKKKTPKKKAVPEEEPPKEKIQKCRLTIAEGKEQPKKGIKDAQRNIMAAESFKMSATPFEINVFGNKLESFPRTFSSGNKGWWGGGKIWIPVGDKKLWATLNLNLTIIGSKEWVPTEAEREQDEDEDSSQD